MLLMVTLVVAAQLWWIQQASGGGSAWIQVDLGAGNETAFDYTFP